MTPTIVNFSERASAHISEVGNLADTADYIESNELNRYVFAYPLVAFGFISQGVLTIKVEHVDDDIESAE
jgi:hypothetical protein